MTDIKNLVIKLRENGMKITPQRLAIFKILENNHQHPSAEDVYQEVLKDYPTVSFTTVYKTLETLRELGEINELAIDSERKHYDPFTDQHFHVICRSCNKIENVHTDVKIKPPVDLAERYQGLESRIDFLGYCPDCSVKH